MSKAVNNICEILFLYKKCLKRSPQIVLFAKCAHTNCKRFKIKIFINTRKVDVFTNSINFYHKKMLTGYLRGITRSLAKEDLLRKKPIIYKRETVLKNSETFALTTKNLKYIKSDSTIRKARSEKLAQFDRDKNDILDIIKLQSDYKHFFKEISFPFRAIFFSLEQVSVLKQIFDASNYSTLIHFDATGSVARHPCKEKKRVLFYAGVVSVNKSHRIFPVMSMLSASHNVGAIYKLFYDFRYFCEENNKWPLFDGIVSDFSLAIIHAAVRAFCNLTLTEYLTVCMNLCENKKHSKNILTMHLCCAHFFKMVCKDIDKLCTNVSTATYLKEFLALAINIDSLQQLDVWFQHISIVLLSPNHNTAVEESIAELSKMTETKFSTEKMINLNALNDLALDKTDLHTLYGSSPFYKRYNNILNRVKESINTTSEGKLNRFSNASLLHIILKKYLPFAPLWTQLMNQYSSTTTVKERISNAIVENYFGNLKYLTLEGSKNLKCSRFIRQHRLEVESVCKEVRLGVDKTCLTHRKRSSQHSQQSQFDENEKSCKESWKKKRKIPYSHFNAKYLGNLKIKKHPELSPEACTNVKLTPSNCSNNDRLYELCSSKLNQLMDCNIKQIEEDTVLQRQSEIWRNERKKRITASWFGKICKSKASTKFNIVKQIKSNNVPLTCPMRHGNKNEGIARELYCQQKDVSCITTGLVIHPKYPFIAGSPDGLIGDSGLIEIKCPFTIRDKNPNEIDLPFLINGKIRITSDYYYQIQGLLEITDRAWCDLVIFTFSGLKIVHIERNQQFWTKVIIPNLKEFYFFYFLVFEVCVNNNTPIPTDTKWRPINDLHFFNNGLVNDPSYYKPVLGRIKTGSDRNRSFRNKNYIIGCFSDIVCPVSELYIEDFVTLNPKELLSSFIIDIYLQLLIRENKNREKYKIMSVEIATHIFCGNISALNIVDTDFVYIYPINENNIHYILIVVDPSTNEFIYLDPLDRGNAQSYKQNQYFNKFFNLMRNNSSNKLWKIKHLPHIYQEDSFNCCILILYYFRQLMVGESLDSKINANKLRTEIQNHLLSECLNVHDLCLYCNRNVLNNEIYTCTACNRKIHVQCLTNIDEFTNRLCELCRQY
ncbi:hypothetical protein RI129_008925 [Pyrocoelia pectoralis]|uniref:Ubiquitin-like protease family profile domain-containing protein n=1 Tax=Pyrocoelia pectoralis TaxID=417401 RepID=A0AAN7ZKJ7_9COLE